MSASPPVSPSASTDTAMTTPQSQVIWQARIWAFLSDWRLRAIPCVSKDFKFCLPIRKMKGALDRALYHQSLAYQALQAAKIQLDWDFSYQRTNVNQSPIEFHEKDPLSKALDCSLTTHHLIKDAITSIKRENMQEPSTGNVSTQTSSSTVEILAEEAPADPLSFLEEEEGSDSTPEDEMAHALNQQTLSCQFQDYATQALAEIQRINLYMDFRLQGASKSQLLPSMLTAQRTEPIFQSPYTIDEDYCAASDETDPIDEALKSSCTTYQFIELAIDWMKGENQEAEGDEREIDSGIQQFQARQTPADPPYDSEEEEGEDMERARNLKPNPNRTALYLPTSSENPNTPSVHFHFNPVDTPDTVTRCLEFTSVSQSTNTPVPIYPHPMERPPYPLWNPVPPSDPRWKEVIMQSQESPAVDPTTKTLAGYFNTPQSAQPNKAALPDDETF